MVPKAFAPLATLAPLLAACASAPSFSVPTISALSLPASVARGDVEEGTFMVSNAAGVSGLTLTVVLLEPGSSVGTSYSTPLVSSGPSSTESTGVIDIDLKANTPSGTYTVTVTVSDGPNTSNALVGTFDVS